MNDEDDCLKRLAGSDECNGEAWQVVPSRRTPLPCICRLTMTLILYIKHLGRQFFLCFLEATWTAVAGKEVYTAGRSMPMM